MFLCLYIEDDENWFSYLKEIHIQHLRMNHQQGPK